MLSTFKLQASVEIKFKPRCYNESAESYYFSRFVQEFDYNVKVSKTAYPYDLAIEIVSDREEADLILTEEGISDRQAPIQLGSKVDLNVCKSLSPTNATVVKLTTTDRDAQITVKMSRYVLNKDYRVFVESEKMSKEEAAAIFAILWKENRSKFINYLID